MAVYAVALYLDKQSECAFTLLRYGVRSACGNDYMVHNGITPYLTLGMFECGQEDEKRTPRHMLKAFRKPV